MVPILPEGLCAIADGGPVGLIAGNGSFPIELLRKAREKGIPTVVVAIQGEAAVEVESLATKCCWIKLGQLGKGINAFKSSAVKRAIMLGGISRIKLFGGIKLDFKGLCFVARLRSFSDDAILRAMAQELERNGISIISPAVLLSESFPEAGLLTKRGLTDAERKDALLAFGAANKIGALDIGQTIVAFDNLIVAVEAVEGTDAAIKRAGELTLRGRVGSGGMHRRKGTGGLVVVKLSKPGQDTRLDIPTIGETTIRSMIEARVSALVIEAKKTMLVKPIEVVSMANENDMAIMVVRGVEDLR